jgi:opacity protein-like surface antigen
VTKLPPLIAAIGALAAAGVAAPSLAEQSPAGPYVGIGWGHFDLNLDNLNDVGTAVNSIAHSGDDAWKILAGYRFSPYFSVEGDYVDFGHPSDTFSGSGSDGNYKLRVTGFAPYLVGTIPAGPIELFAKAGYLYYDSRLDVNLNSPGTEVIESSHSRSSFVYGGGVGVTLIDHLNVNAEFDGIRIENARNSNALWLSTAWRF